MISTAEALGLVTSPDLPLSSIFINSNTTKAAWSLSACSENLYSIHILEFHVVGDYLVL